MVDLSANMTQGIEKPSLSSQKHKQLQADFVVQLGMFFIFCLTVVVYLLTMFIKYAADRYEIFREYSSQQSFSDRSSETYFSKEFIKNRSKIQQIKEALLNEVTKSVAQQCQSQDGQNQYSYVDSLEDLDEINCFYETRKTMRPWQASEYGEGHFDPLKYENLSSVNKNCRIKNLSSINKNSKTYTHTRKSGVISFGEHLSQGQSGDLQSKGECIRNLTPHRERSYNFEESHEITSQQGSHSFI